MSADVVDLAATPVRALNEALHALGRDTNRTYWRVLNPRGQHAVAVGVDAPVRIEIAGHTGYYCAGMNNGAISWTNRRSERPGMRSRSSRIAIQDKASAVIEHNPR